MNNIETFKRLNNEVQDLENKNLDNRSEILAKKAQLEVLIEEICKSHYEKIEESMVKWLLNNPIEAISYYLAKELEIDTIYYKNDSKHVELFEESIESISRYKDRYILINVHSLKQTVINVKDICNYYSSIPSKIISLELDFLDNYKIDLIKEVGKYYDENTWSIKYKALNSKNYSKLIYEIIENNFIINELESIEDELVIKQENIEYLLNQYENELELSYRPNRTFSIYNEDNLIGFICLHVYKNTENKYVLNVESFEIFSKYRDLGLGSKVISILQDRYGIDIEGYSYPDDKVVNFWIINGADFDSCENCEENHTCNGFECDEPLDYCFVIPSYNL